MPGVAWIQGGGALAEVDFKVELASSEQRLEYPAANAGRRSEEGVGEDWFARAELETLNKEAADELAKASLQHLEVREVICHAYHLEPSIRDHLELNRPLGHAIAGETAGRIAQIVNAQQNCQSGSRTLQMGNTTYSEIAAA